MAHCFAVHSPIPSITPRHPFQGPLDGQYAKIAELPATSRSYIHLVHARVTHRNKTLAKRRVAHGDYNVCDDDDDDEDNVLVAVMEQYAWLPISLLRREYADKHAREVNRHTLSL